jgi:nucleotide-binding universal stress UspA family protein
MTSEHEPGRIVVGVDGSEGSKAALRWAARIAPGLDAHIEAVTAWDYPATYGLPAYVEDFRPDLDAEKVLHETLEEVFGAHRPSGLRGLVRQGHPREVLLAAARGARMLVLGSRGHGGFAGLLLGSVSAACAEHAPCAVLVAHGDPEPGAAAVPAAAEHA